MKKPPFKIKIKVWVNSHNLLGYEISDSDGLVSIGTTKTPEQITSMANDQLRRMLGSKGAEPYEL